MVSPAMLIVALVIAIAIAAEVLQLRGASLAARPAQRGSARAESHAQP